MRDIYEHENDEKDANILMTELLIFLSISLTHLSNHDDENEV